MKAKLLLLLITLLNTLTLFSQDYIMKMETNIKGMGMGDDKMKIEYIISYKANGEMKTQTKGKEFSMDVSVLKEKVKIIRKEKGYSDLCAEGTPEEFNEENSKNTPTVEYKDIKIEKLKETATVAGYACKSAKVSYKTTGIMSMKQESIVWYTDEIEMSDSKNISTNTDQQQNAYTDALKTLGHVLKTESKGMVSMTMEVTEFKKQDLAVSDLDLDISGCKKTLTIKDYNKQVSQRELSKQQSQQNSNDQMRRNQRMMGH